MLKRIIGKLKDKLEQRRARKEAKRTTKHYETQTSKWGDAMQDLLRGKKFSENEGRLSAEEYAVKARLGQSFFSRRLAPATRRKRVSDLTSEQRRIARQLGWIS